MENSEQTIQSKRQALSKALGRTDLLMDTFMDVLRQDFTEKDRKPSDFSAVAERLIPEEKPAAPEPEPASMTFGRPYANVRTDEDERLHMSFPALVEDALACKRCSLCSTRNNVVFGTGCMDRPVVMVVGEAPGENEDIQGLPFVGKAGQYLDSWLKAISLSRETNVYITNIVKCRPPENRDPLPDEKEACFAFLRQQIEIVHPQAILCLGKSASGRMTGQAEASMSSMRGRFYFFEGIPLICTYHPAAVLRNLELKRPVWEDLKKLARYLGLATGGKS